MIGLLDVKKQLLEIGRKPRVDLGQNFLVSRHIHEKMVEAGKLEVGDVVLEVGAGLGNLSVFVAPVVKDLYCVEYDRDLIPLLKRNVESWDQVEVVWGDIRELDWLSLVGTSGYKVVGNVPYYLTSFLFRMFLEAQEAPDLLVFLVQWEVANRLQAKSPEMNILAVLVQLRAEVEVLHKVKAGSFWPRPTVDSSIVRLIPKKPFVSGVWEKIVHLVRLGFSQRRKMLAKVLSQGLNCSRQEVEDWLVKLGKPKKARAQELEAEDWVVLQGVIGEGGFEGGVI